MGSIGYASSLNTRDALRERIYDVWNQATTELLDYSIQPMVRGRGEWSMVGYAAVRNRKTGEVFAGVSLAAKGGGMFYVKDLDETVGPVADALVPKRILKRLTPTTFEYAIEWRARMWELHDTVAAANEAAIAAVGHTVEFEQSLTYGEPVGEVTRAKVVSPTLFIDPNTGYRMRAPKLWAAQPHAVIS